MTFGITNISSLQFSMFNRRNVQSTTLALQRAGQELATGRKADIFADLGSNAVSTIKLRAREADTPRLARHPVIASVRELVRIVCHNNDGAATMGRSTMAVPTTCPNRARLAVAAMPCAGSPELLR